MFLPLSARLNSAIVGTPVTFFTTTQAYRPPQTPALRARGNSPRALVYETSMPVMQ